MIEVVCAIVKWNDRFLICQRPPHKNQGLKWEFPGGKMEADESPEQAIHREIEEELGLKISIIDTFPPVHWVYHNENRDLKLKLIPFLCEPIQYPNLILSEHIGSQWLSLDELRSFGELCAADQNIVSQDWLS